MENILMDGNCLSLYACKINAKQFDWLNIDGLAGKRQKRQNSPPPVKILCYTVISTSNTQPVRKSTCIRKPPDRLTL